ncbi:MAG: sulfatase-like hydrolase/transferase [Opitutaceae bacterium]
MMEVLDDGVGRVLARLDELGLKEKTLVIFYADNGGLLRDGAQTPWRGGKAQLYEGGIRVPLIMRWPGVAP